MIDTLNLTISDFVLTEETKLRLKLRVETKENTGEITSIKGHLKNLFLSIRPNANNGHDLFITGSIRKYYMGVPALDDLTYTQLWAALEMLSMDLGINFKQILTAKIRRIDIGITLQVPRPVIQYLHTIHSTPKLKKKGDQYDETIDFKGANKRITFYDKYKEVKKECQKSGIPGLKPTFDGKPLLRKNWLRIELQFLKLSGTRKQLNNLTYVYELYRKMPVLIERFLEEFSHVKFVSNALITLTKPLTKTLDILTMALLYTMIDCKTTLGLLDQLKSQGIISSKKLTDTSKQVIRVSDLIEKKDNRDYKKFLLNQLERKLKQKYQFYYADIISKPISIKGNLADTTEISGIYFQLYDSETLKPVE